MKKINFVFSILHKFTLLSLICDTHEMNTQRQTSVISNFLYIEVFTQVPWTSIYPSFTVYPYKIVIYHNKTTLRAIQTNPPNDMLLMSSRRSIMLSRRPLGLTAPLSNNTLSMIHSPKNTQWSWLDLSMPPRWNVMGQAEIPYDLLYLFFMQNLIRCSI